MQCFEELTVIMPRLARPRLRRIENLQHNRPIVLRHPRQHRPAPHYRSPIDETRFGEPLPSTFFHPSTHDALLELLLLDAYWKDYRKPQVLRDTELVVQYT